MESNFESGKCICLSVRYGRVQCIMISYTKHSDYIDDFFAFSASHPMVPEVKEEPGSGNVKFTTKKTKSRSLKSYLP